MATMEDDNLFGLEPDQVSSLLEQESQQQVAQDYRGNPINQAGANLGRLFGNTLFGNVMGMQRPEVQMAMRMQQMKMGVEQDAMNQGIDAMSDPEQFNKLVVKHALAANLPQIAYKAAINARGLELNRRSIQAKEQEAQAMATWRQSFVPFNEARANEANSRNPTKVAIATQNNEAKVAIANDTNATKKEVASTQAQGQRDRGATAATIRSGGTLKPLFATPNQIKATGPVLDAAGIKFGDVTNKVTAAKYVAERTMYYQSVQHIKDPTQAQTMAINDLKNHPGFNKDNGGIFSFSPQASFDPSKGGTAAPNIDALLQKYGPKQ